MEVSLPYLAGLLGVGLFCTAAGYLVGARRRAAGERVSARVVLVLVGVLLLWHVMSLYARGYAETACRGWAFAEMWAHSLRWYVFEGVLVFFAGLSSGSRLGARKFVEDLKHTVLLVVGVGAAAWSTYPVGLVVAAEGAAAGRAWLRQSVEYTCAPVCLANHARRSGLACAAGERDLALRCGTTVAGTRLSRLARVARELGIRTECRLVTFEELVERNGPALLMISTLPSVRHATLFLGADAEGLHLLDPAYGPRTVPAAYLRRVWYGKTILLGGASHEPTACARP